MRIWVLKTGEPVPVLPAEAGDRRVRAAAMVQAAREAGHDATWWTARFNHQKKHMRAVPADRVLPPEAYGAADPATAPDMVFLSSPGYRRHIAPRRFWDHRVLGRRFAALAPSLPRPDVIVAAYPTLELADRAVAFGRARGIPVVVDIRDLWPDILAERLAARAGPLAPAVPALLRGALPYEAMARRIFGGATAATALSRGMLDWARGRFGGDPTRDRVVHQSMRAPGLAELARAAARADWAARGVDLEAP
ncbi:MAG: hypothetical protein ACU0CO_14965, partial [Shimia sp.]